MVETAGSDVPHNAILSAQSRACACMSVMRGSEAAHGQHV